MLIVNPLYFSNRKTIFMKLTESWEGDRTSDFYGTRWQSFNSGEHIPELLNLALHIRNRLHNNSRKIAEHMIWILLLKHFLTFFPIKASVGSQVVMALLMKNYSANKSRNPWIPTMSWGTPGETNLKTLPASSVLRVLMYTTPSELSLSTPMCRILQTRSKNIK